MKSKKKSVLIHKDIMVEGMMFCIKAFAIVCVITSFSYFLAGHTDTISRIFSL